MLPAEFVASARSNGLRISASGCVLTLSASFAPGDHAAFCRVDHNASYLLASAPRTAPGSTWGSDGIGAVSAIRDGRYVRNASGIGKRFVSAVSKLA